MQLFKDQKKYQMNSNLEIAVILLDITNYFFVFLLVFNLFKVNYFNPIVTIFLKIYKPISKVLGIFPNQIITTELDWDQNHDFSICRNNHEVFN